MQNLGFLALLGIVTALTVMEHTPTRRGRGVLPDGRRVETWACQLQGADFMELLGLDVSLLVVDPDDSKLTREQVEALKLGGKVVLAYMSVGAAEEWREYWREEWRETPPDWLAEPDPMWPGSHLVKFWRREWGEILRSRLDGIIQRGYDGVYLDVVDAYREWEARGVWHAREMVIELVAALSKYAKGKNPNFIVIPQNCPELIVDTRFAEAVDGLGMESLWYIYDRPRREAEVAWALRYLDRVVEMGKLVLVIDYVTVPSEIRNFFKKARKRGYIPYVGTLKLDRIGYYEPP